MIQNNLQILEKLVNSELSTKIQKSNIDFEELIFEINEDNTLLSIFPYSPIPSNKESFAIVFKVFNPRKSGLYQFHSFGQYIGENPISSYLGSSTIVID